MTMTIDREPSVSGVTGGGPLRRAGFARGLDQRSVRAAAGAFLAGRGVPATRAGDALLVLAELLSNACRHGQGSARAWVSVLVDTTPEGAVYIEVRDPSPLPPRVVAGAEVERDGLPGAVHGRGLRLVDALAAWGFDCPRTGRKRVYACLWG
jgi:anti-sigma regulatory factor (Ser/Thr protein kinase)